MIDFNPAWIYYLAEAFTNLNAVHRKVALPDVAYILHESRTGIAGFLTHQEHTLFPETRDRVKDVLVWIDVIAPPEEPVQNRVLGESEIVGLASAVNGAIISFEAECGRIFIVGLEKQRALHPKTLIEEIDSAFSPECWKRLSKVAKREIEECGKCLAFERYTAAGFHVLRGLESEVRDYIWLLPVPTPHKRDLGYYIGILKDNGADPKLISSLDNIRSLDRNPLMHPEDWLTKDEAIGIFNTAHTAFERLISDMEKRGLLPPSSV